MAELYTCRCCGANIEVSANGKTGECKYCGTKVVFPKAGFTRINQAEAYRKRREFEQAEAIYRSLSIAFPDDPEIWWNILLCEYGIEYIEEGDRRVPTINRMKYDSIYGEMEYQKVISCADEEMKPIYEEAAAEIEALQKRLQEIIANEKEYEVFISFKDKDDATGDRTVDSVIAQEIYDALTLEGYRVFFSRVTLRQAIAQEFDPKIYAALTKAPMLLLVGSSKEYINSTWVKSEWSRYLKLMEKDSTKFILPVCVTMKPEELPGKLRNLEAIETNSLGYLDKILNNVSERLGRKKEKRIQKNIEKNIVSLEKDELKRITQLGYEALEKKEWKKAEDYFESALDINVSCAEAWWGKLGVLTKNFTARIDFERHEGAQEFINAAMKYASEEEKARYEKVLEQFKITQQEYVCKDLLDVFNKKTDHMHKLWFEGTPEENQIIKSIQDDEKKILEAAPHTMKSTLEKQFKEYNLKQTRVRELKKEFDKTEETNKSFVDKIKEIQNEIEKEQNVIKDIPRKYPFRKIIIFEVIVLPMFLAAALIGNIVGVILSIITLLPVFLRIRTRNRVKAKAKNNISSLSNALENTRTEARNHASGLEKTYTVLKDKYSDVAVYVIPAALNVHIDNWKKVLL